MAIKKIRMRPEGGNDYADVLHPETSGEQVKFKDGSSAEEHKAETVLISGGTFTGIVKAHPNTSNTVAQIRNIILSPNDAVAEEMEDGEVWIKYE